jgi:D-alanine-D-alanine ligase
MINSEITVGLLLGGASPERAVSKHSAEGVLKALRALNYNVVLIDPAYGVNQPATEKEYFVECDCFPISSSNYLDAVNSHLFDNIDIVFNALHGSWGEDGTIQALLEFRKIPYTGSGILASAASMDKHITKSIIKHGGVTTANWLLIEKRKFDFEELKKTIKNDFTFPLVVKPNDQGSAIGLSICGSVDELEEGISLAFQFSKNILVEQYIDGYEVTVGIVDEEILPVLEIKPKHSYYDYECKYTAGMSEYEVPAKFPKEVCELLQSQAMLAYKSVGCKNYGRIDFRLDKKLNPFCLEINTLPGLTSTSLLPKAAKAIGLSFENLIDKIIHKSLNE